LGGVLPFFCSLYLPSRFEVNTFSAAQTLPSTPAARHAHPWCGTALALRVVTTLTPPAPRLILRARMRALLRQIGRHSKRGVFGGARVSMSGEPGSVRCRFALAPLPSPFLTCMASRNRRMAAWTCATRLEAHRRSFGPRLTRNRINLLIWHRRQFLPPPSRRRSR